MAKRTISGLYQRNGVWYIDKIYRGQRIRESTGSGDRKEAEQYLIHRLEQLRQQHIYGVRRVRTWREAATRYLVEYKDQPSIGLTALYLEQLDPYIGDRPVDHIDDEALAPYVKDRLAGRLRGSPEKGRSVAPRTINIALERVIRVLNLCARKWRDEARRPWLDTVPMITRLDLRRSTRQPHPLSWEEQSLLFTELPDHLKRMALYKVNSGSREQEVVKLRWDWEIPVPELGTSVFLIPADFGGRHENAGVKNGDERLIVLNSVAKSVIEGQRGLDPLWVFPYGQVDKDGNATPMHRMNDSAWRKARKRAAAMYEQRFKRTAPSGFASIRVHDLKHTFGRRLRAAGVTEEDRKVLLGHKNGSITSHYSAAELGKLIDEANKISATDSRGPALTILRRKAG
ncbi:tyrosine-type recombinase/integrase [Stutzerimonas decontaminans]|uniref:Integrase n=1 Tax=Stutzerimonas stutzeri TaxID=316 RepID=A0A023WSA4_STUST|nr:integrase [Stutzerimonas decontaminans]